MSARANTDAERARAHNAVEDERLSLDRASDGRLTVKLTGAWQLRREMPMAAGLEHELQASVRSIDFDSQRLTGWDSSLVNFLIGLDRICRARGIEVDRAGLPDGLRRLVGLAEAVSGKEVSSTSGANRTLAERVGRTVIEYAQSAANFIEFIGDVTLTLRNFFLGRARFRAIDLLEVTQACSVNALAIVTLISYLVGVILAFMGAIQLEQFGAAIYVADLVAIGTVREMGAMMTAIIMAGRTGAAFAAQLGTMKVTQEIDALATMGISPMEFLVLPRMIALVLMMPLLCLYSDLLGILGGSTVGVSMLGLSFNVYLHESIRSVHLMDLGGGLFKAATYGVLVAVAGCYEGFQCGDSSSAVGDVATAAVVNAIVLIVVACGVYAVLFHILRI